MAVGFDGSTYLQQTRKLRNVVNSKKLTLSFWFKADDGEGGVVLFGGPSATERVQIEITAAGKISTVVRNSAGTKIYESSTDTAYDDGEWHHVAISIDLSTQTVLVYVDRTSSAVTVTTAAADDTIDFEGATEWDIGQSYQAGGTAYQGELFDLVFKAGTALDLTDADVLRTLVSSDGASESQSDQYRQNVGPDKGPKPVGYGPGGSKVFGGESADILYSGAFNKNRGAGGDFALVGAFDFSRGPEIYRNAALKPTPGERWFDSEQSGFSYPRSETVVEQREGLPSYGKRIGLDEVDEKTRQERPGLSFQQIVLGTPGLEDDSEEDRT